VEENGMNARKQRNLSPRSEEELLELIRKELPSPSRSVLSGIGDDCAVIRHSSKNGVLELLKTDALIEKVHFKTGTPLAQIGWKALCRPLSDIAAMGGTPRHAVITVAAPPSWGSKEWRALYQGIGKAAMAFAVSIVGGETVRSPGPLFLSIAMTGDVPKENLRLRSTARAGDLLCVTGKLGGSFKSGRHLRFTPRLSEGRWLASQHGVTSMMDLSDGLGSDLPKLAQSSTCSFRIVPEAIPLHRACTIQEALTDGEDYELLLSVAPKLWPALQSRFENTFPKLSLTVIGSLLPVHESPTPLPLGHDHLRS
jgi:thiamine-monophosphate kinase